jgi:long-chain acyl-CoA synthetase
MGGMERIWMKSWPENIPRELKFPEKPLHEFLRDQARLNPEKPAIIFYGTEITFRELDRRTDQLAAALGSLGLKKGDRAALFMENSPQFVIGYFAILKAGGVVAAANPMFKEDELGYEVGDAGAKILICQDILYPKVEPIREKSGIGERWLPTSIRAWWSSSRTFPKQVPGRFRRRSCGKGRRSLLEFSPGLNGGRNPQKKP